MEVKSIKGQSVVGVNVKLSTNEIYALKGIVERVNSFKTPTETEVQIKNFLGKILGNFDFKTDIFDAVDEKVKDTAYMREVAANAKHKLNKRRDTVEKAMEAVYHEDITGNFTRSEWHEICRSKNINPDEEGIFMYQGQSYRQIELAPEEQADGLWYQIQHWDELINIDPFEK